MKTSFRSAILTLIGTALTATAAVAGVFEPWTIMDTANIGTYQDTNGSIIMFLTTDGPKAGEKALKVESTLKPGGYCGIWHNISANLPKDGAVKFMAKSTKPGELQVSIKDKYNMQYTAFTKIPSNEWSEVTVNVSSFRKDTTYTPPDAIKGKPMDVSETKGLNFGPKMEGDATILIGPLYTGDASKKAAAPAAAAPAAEKPAEKPAVAPAAKPAAAKSVAAKPVIPKGTGAVVVLQNFSALDGGSGAAWKDEMGSTMELSLKDTPTQENPRNKAVSAKYHQASGGYCGFWFRAGDKWDGLDCSNPVALKMRLFTEAPMVIGLTLSDVNKNEINVNIPRTRGGKWETVTVPVTDVPADFKIVKVLHVYPRTPGSDGSFSIDWLRLLK